jgi:hypothetical protein
MSKKFEKFNLVALFFLIMLISCHSISKKNINAVDTATTIRFYYRDVTAVNEYSSYSDNIIIENYINNKYTVKQLADLASKYIDTAKADLPISGIMFYGEKEGKTLPRGMPKLYYQHAKYAVISFGFDNSLEKKIKGKPVIKLLNLWKKGEVILSSTPLDSLLKSDKLIDNEN